MEVQLERVRRARALAPAERLSHAAERLSHARKAVNRGLDCVAAVQHSQRDVHAPRIAKEGVTYEILVFSDLQKKGKGRM